MTAITETALQLPYRGRRAIFPMKTKIAVLLLALFTIFITWRARVLEMALDRLDAEPALVSQPAPEFSLTTLDGSRTVSLSDFRGQKKVVISFWASWCGPCREEMPALVDFYKRNHGESSDFEILAVSIDEDAKQASSFAAAQKMNFPVLLDDHQKMAEAYHIDSIPTMLVIDKDGKVTYGHIGYDVSMTYWLTQQLGIKEKTSRGGSEQ